MATSDQIDKSCTITNNSKQDVVVLDAFNSSTNITHNKPQQGYQQELKTLPLTKGGDVIKSGDEGTVMLDDTRTDSSGETKYNMLYQLLISDPKSLSPVKDVSVMLDFMSTPETYPKQTVTADDAKKMAQGLEFCRHIMAYPSSKLAKGFVSAVQDAQQKKSVKEMMQAIADYFNTTKGFKGLDFPSYLCANTFLRSFAWTWGLDDDNNAGRTYWLYAASDAGTQPSSAKESPNHGSVQLSRLFSQLSLMSPYSADPTDRGSGYTITYTPKDGSATTLYFSNGQFVDNVNSDTPSVCLQGSFALKSQFTHKDSDLNLWPVLVGTVAGTKVLGVSQPPKSWWQKNIADKTFDDWINLFLKVMGVWMALDFLATKLKGKQNKAEDTKANENNGREPTQEQMQEADQASQQVGENALNEVRSSAGHMGEAAPQVPDEEGLPAAVEDVKSTSVDVLKNITSDHYEEMIKEYKGQLETLAEVGVDPALEDATQALSDAQKALPDTRQSGDFNTVNEKLGSTKDSIGTAVENLDPSQEVRDQLAESQQAIDDFKKIADETEDRTEDMNNDEDPAPEEAPEELIEAPIEV